MKFSTLATGIAAAVVMAVPAGLRAQDAPLDEAEVMSEPVPQAVIDSAVQSVRKLGEQVVLGRYQVALERMNPTWKKRTAARMGGMAKLERELEGVAAEMLRQGISMISFKPQGRPISHEVSPGTRKVVENGVEKERMAFTKWMILVPTVTQFRIIAEGHPRPVIIESTGFQVAISDKDKLDWTFIEGSGLTPADLRGMFITLSKDMELPPVGRKEVR